MRSNLAYILVTLGLPLRGESQARPGGAWELTTPRSATADQPSITLELDALNVVRGAMVTFRPALYLRCLNEKLEAFVATGALRERDSDYRTTVRLRWADRPPLEETWRRSTDYAAVFAPDAAAFVQQLLATPEMAFEFRPADADAIIARFNGAGLATHLPRLKAKCPASIPAPPIRGRADREYAEAEVDERAEVRSLPDPEYPPLLRRAGVKGTVILQFVIDTLGRAEPGSLRVVSSSHPAFNEPALNAIRRGVFRPARVRGQAVRVRMPFKLEFTPD